MSKRSDMSAHATPEFKNPVIRWIDYRLPIFTFVRAHLGEYQTPKNLNYMWNFGSLAGIALIIMILSGIFLAMHYQPNIDSAFNSVERIMRDVNYGWLIRYLHMNGASMFFLVVYIHTFRGLYYGSYKAPREILWMLGVLILFIMMPTAFLGYVLVWGQQSFWAATVITSMVSAVPFVGEPLVQWLWGGFAVDNPTLNRFFALHYLLPMIIVGIAFVHLWALHVHKSNNPLGIDIREPKDTIPFHPYFTVKDALGLAAFLLLFATFLFFAPNTFTEPDNYIPANPMVTPAQIVPEWYLLPFYTILRAIPHKLLGVIAMTGGIAILFLMPWLDRSPVRSARYRPVYRMAFWIFLADCLILGYLGAQTAEEPYTTAGRLATFYYFAHFVIIVPLIARYEKTKPLPVSISEEFAKTHGGHTSKKKKEAA